MIGRRSVIGISVLFALALCAFGAVGASAAQRAVLCSANTESGKEQFSDAHCKTAATGAVGFKHVEIANGTPTAISGTNAKTASGTAAAAPSKLKGTLAGVETEVECTSTTGTGTLTNSATFVSGTGTITYGGCKVTKPAGQGCVVTSPGTITTETLAATTESLAANEVKFKPNSGTKFATVPISGCETVSLNNNFPVTGSLIATASGATLTTTTAGVEGQNTLKFGGNKAGLEGSLTISNSAGTSAISLT